jgi:hypothetical protein
MIGHGWTPQSIQVTPNQIEEENPKILACRFAPGKHFAGAKPQASFSPELGAMLSRIVCKVRSSARSPQKHADFAKPACFRGDFSQIPILQISRESMAPQTFRLLQHPNTATPKPSIAA